MSKILITGAAGFIGFHLAKRLVGEGCAVVGLDNLNSYYDVKLKEERLRHLTLNKDFRFTKMDLAEREPMAKLFEEERFDTVVNLAAQVGVRNSVLDPLAYVDSNIVGFAHVLECCHQTGVKHLVFASSSAVYGANTGIPFSVHHNTDHPLSMYAATKKANELMAHTYAWVHRLPCTGLRFFTVYGPWGRPDMAMFKFTKAILEEEPIDVYNFGKMKRDFTYIDDIVEGVMRILDRVPSPVPNWSGDHPDPASSLAPFRTYNIGNNDPVELTRFIEAIESAVGKKARINLLPLQAGDLPSTFADIDDLERDVCFRPRTRLEDGVRKFVEWYRWYYKT